MSHPEGQAWEDAKWRLMEHASGTGGTVCPMCDQHVQVYRRKINSGMAASLIRMWRIGSRYGPDGLLTHPGGWVHVPTEIGARSREEGKLAYWGLVEEDTELREDRGRAGWWRVTPAGRVFINGGPVPKYLRIYNGKVVETEPDELVTIRDALGTKFNYDDLMRGV